MDIPFSLTHSVRTSVLYSVGDSPYFLSSASKSALLYRRMDISCCPFLGDVPELARRMDARSLGLLNNNFNSLGFVKQPYRIRELFDNGVKTWVSYNKFSQIFARGNVPVAYLDNIDDYNCGLICHEM